MKHEQLSTCWRTELAQDWASETIPGHRLFRSLPPETHLKQENSNRSPTSKSNKGRLHRIQGLCHTGVLTQKRWTCPPTAERSRRSMIDLNRITIESPALFRTKSILIVRTESGVLKTFRRSTARLLRVTRSLFEGIFRSLRTIESGSPRTYAALAGDGLMPEVMPPLATDE